MDPSQQLYKRLAKVALAAMGALFVLGVLFYKERVLFSDAAFYIFHIINSSRLVIPGPGSNRYGAFIVEMLPYLARKMHSSVGTIVFLYGISFNLFYFIAAFFVFRYKQYALCIIMALYYFLFVSESYIWVSETFDGAAWMFLFFAAILRFGEKRTNVLLFIVPFLVFSFLAVFSHFVVIIPMTFLWVYLIIERKHWPFSRNISVLLSCIFMFVISLKFIDTHSAYDSDHLRGITHFSLKDILTTFRTPVVKIFFRRCVSNYWLGTLAFVISVVTLVRKKEFVLAAWTFLSVVGYIILMGLTYADLDQSTLLFHIECEWSYLAIIVATPFVSSFLPGLRLRVAAWSLVGIFAIRLAYMISFLPLFSARNDFKEQVLGQMRKKGIKKLALIGDPKLLATTVLDWGLPYETILVSAGNGDNPQLTFLFVNPDDKRKIEELTTKSGFYDAWYMAPCASLNNDYFRIDTTKPYVVMTYAEFLK